MRPADVIRSRLPCSVELPAGCGKTELIADLVQAGSDDRQCALVLTHTHAGVDAIRTRLRRHGVPASAYRVATLDSWCFHLIAHYQQLADLAVAREPDWSKSRAYHEAGARAVRSTAVGRMLQATYDLLIVDEYQDCQKWQHELVKSIAEVLPVCVLGDRLQGLFFFGKANDPVRWADDVLTVFPAVELPITAWRWAKTNPELGEWLIDLRGPLLGGEAIDLAAGPIAIADNRGATSACYAQPPHPERVVVIAPMEHHCRRLAQRLGGTYTMLEELEGKHLLKFAQKLDLGASPEIAAETVDFAVSCAVGPADVLPSASRKRLRGGKPLSSSGKLADHVTQVDALNLVLHDATPGAVRKALIAISQLPMFKLHRREAWFGVLSALRLAETTEGLSVQQAVTRERNQLRTTGRRPGSRILARPLLVKGLEFDHAVVPEVASYNAHELYVALTRGSRSVTVITDDPIARPRLPAEETPG
jgi:hypothetical protein